MKTCPIGGKHCYRSADHAKRVMRHLSASQRTYKCSACGQGP